MNKLKFALSNVWYWVSFTLITFLVENLLHLTPNPKAGFNMSSLFVISFACVACLFLFYFVQHKYNKLKIDWVLLPAMVIIGGCFVAAIWLNKGSVYPFKNGSGEITVSFTWRDKLRATVILVIFLAFMYAMLYATRINGLRNRTMCALAIVGICASLISLVYSLIVEKSQYELIFKDDEITHIVIDSFYGNKNYYGGVLLVGLLCCFVLNIYRPNFFSFLFGLIFTIAIISSGAMLPAIIASIAYAIYLLEETAYFAVKKRWLYVFFSMFFIITVIILVVLFYLGSSMGWKGFTGMNNYMSELLSSKNFHTFTGRTYIWEEVLPYCFDNPISMILGHGFLLSEKSILAITSAMYNGASVGVRTTHSGYLQTLFEYGLVGAVVHVFLICFFIYCCIRNLMEKRFHFVFIYVFAALCCAAYNFCESSSFFDAGVKEMFMTQLIMVPVITKAKFASRPAKLEEIRAIEAPKRMDPVVLGRGIALFLASLILVFATPFLCSVTYENTVLRDTFIFILVILGIAILFLPYLISLYYRNTDPSIFVAHCLVNLLLIGAAVTISYLFMNYSHTMRPYAMYGAFGIAVFILLMETIIYSLVKGGNIKEYDEVLLRGALSCSSFAFFGALIGAFAFISITHLGIMNMFIYVMCMFITLIGFYGMFTFLPTKRGREILEQLNGVSLSYIQRLTEKDLTYYG